jgi:riboflavin kinase/FMN adenylyltransferase
MNKLANEKRIAVALGDFDGMHRAHQTVVTGADDVIVYCVNNKFSLLQKSIFQKRFPNAVFADFDEIKNMQGQEFIEKILVEKFGAGIILCGYNFKFGRNAGWSAIQLRQYLAEKDIWVRILEHLDFEGQPISSTRIRQALKDGKIEQANEMLGYNFTFEAEVIHGDNRGGKKIGFPTINQHLPQGLVVPKFGVYESRTFVDDKEYKSFTNIGIRPTWEVDVPLCETNIFDYDGNLYGKNIRVELIRYLREEKKFSSIDEVRTQLEYDKSSII